MKRKIVQLNIDELKPGMVLVNEVQQNRKVLMAKDTILTEPILEQLKNLYILDKIEIYEEYESNESKAIKNLEHKFNEISFSLQQVYMNVNALQKNNIREVRELCTKIQNEAQEASVMIKNVVFYGSKNDSIYRHGINVAVISNLIGRWIGLEENRLNLLTYAAIMHDIGKVKIDTKITEKTKPLTVSEQEIMQTHCLLGYNIIKDINFLDKSVGQAILMHHEREDGSGYPLGLTGEKIFDFSKIIAIADVFDSLNSNRYLKASNGPFETIKIIKNESFSKLDYRYCDIFIKHLLNYYIGENVLLNTDEVCQIVQMDINNLERPLILKQDEFIDLRKHKELYIKSLIV